MYVDDRTTSRTALDGFRLAVGTLSAVRIAPPTAVDTRVGRVAMLLAPVAVVPLAVLVAGIGWMGTLIGLPSLVVATLAVGALVLANRCFHLDGLADTADGLAASYERERALEIMHRSDTGPAGVAAMVLLLATQIGALATVISRPYGWLLAGVIVCCSRSVLALACHRAVPAARRSGLASTVASTVPTYAAVLVIIVTLTAMAAATQVAGAQWWHGIAGTAAAMASAAVLLRRCVRRFGGVTGDVLGACIELTLAVLLVAVSTGG